MVYGNDQQTTCNEVERQALGLAMQSQDAYANGLPEIIVQEGSSKHDGALQKELNQSHSKLASKVVKARASMRAAANSFVKAPSKQAIAIILKT